MVTDRLLREEEQMKQVSQYRGMEYWNSSKFSGLTGGLFFLCSIVYLAA
jgi:hypothetical protein